MNIVAKAGHYLRQRFGRKTSTPVQDSLDAIFFVRSGYEYYANARFAACAGSSYVCGNLFHHAVEMLLKADLAKNGKTLDELASMRHNLKRLWRAYKQNYPTAALSRHDSTINRLDKHEDIRYPDPSLGSIGVSIEWSGQPGSVKVYGRGMRSPKQYAVVVSDIDDLVADLIHTSSWNPGAFAGTNPDALEAIRYRNTHADFLTMAKSPERRFPLPGPPRTFVPGQRLTSAALARTMHKCSRYLIRSFGASGMLPMAYRRKSEASFLNVSLLGCSSVAAALSIAISTTRCAWRCED